MSELVTTPAAGTAPEQLTAWQRWELPSFESTRLGDLELPTASKLEAIQRQAQEEGFQRGYAEGVQKAAQENQRLALLIDSLAQQVDEQIARELLDLSLDVARQMIHQSLKVKPELLLSVVREAIGSLPHFNQAAHVVLHPADAALVRERMGEQLTHSGWKIFEDARIERGGARFDTANSQIDATLETRWKRIVTALGKDNAWLVEE